MFLKLFFQNNAVVEFMVNNLDRKALTTFGMGPVSDLNCLLE